MTADRPDGAAERFEEFTDATARSALDRLDAAVDCSEYRLDGLDRLEFLERVRERDGELPFVPYTDDDSEPSRAKPSRCARE